MKRQVLKTAAVLLALLVPAVAIALSIDPNRNVVLREETSHQPTYYSFTVNYNDPNIASGVAFAKLPQNAFITDIACHVTTVFNAVTTNLVTVGTSSTATSIIDAATANASINELSATYQKMSASPALGIGVTSAADVTLYAKYTQTGTAATAGAVRCTITWIPDNDM